MRDPSLLTDIDERRGDGVVAELQIDLSPTKIRDAADRYASDRRLIAGEENPKNIIYK
jgi:hypothetical protein